MARTNQSQFALLGLLSLGPMSGYDLRQLSSWSVGHFWREGYGQIYPTLKKMTAQGLVSRKVEAKAGKPDRHLYALTAAGRKELTAWLQKPAAPEVHRNEFLLKLFFGGQAPANVNAEHVAARRAQAEQALTTYQATRKRIEREAANNPQKPFWLMTLSYGEHLASAAKKWCDETLRELKRSEVRTSE